jgi:SAM-dependent methyltransferase
MDEQLRKQQEHYDKGWHDGLEAGREELGNLQTNLEFLAETDLLKPEHRILEIGCGIGSLVQELTRRGYDVIGTDISQEAIAYGRQKYGDIHLEVQAAEALDYEAGSFDIVLSFDVLEHIAEVDRHVSEVFRVLRPGGYYLFQTPNKYTNIIFETLQTKSLRWRRYHPSLHSPARLRRRLRKHGFRVEFVKMNPVNEFTLSKLRKLGPVTLLVKHINFRRLPMILQTNMYVVARKSSKEQQRPSPVRE